MPKIRYRVGDHVQFSFGVSTIRGIVKEDRGPIGIKGRRLYSVEFCLEPQSPSTSIVELPAEEMLPAKPELSAK